MADINKLIASKRDVRAKERRDAFTMAVLTGICATPISAMASQEADGPGKVALLAMMIADSTINTLDRIDPPKRGGAVQ